MATREGRVEAAARPETLVGYEARRRAMDRAGAEASGGLYCPECATDLHQFRDQIGLPGETRCPRCGLVVRAGAPGQDEGRRGRKCRDVPVLAHATPPLGGVRLVWRNGVLRVIERLYWVVTFTGTMALLVCGGLVPVVRAWLRNEVDDWAGVVATLGGIWFRVETQNPDSDLGPGAGPGRRPALFATIDAVGRRLGVKPPGQVRLTYLPCCGVVAWGGSRALIIGLPLFRVLTQGELRAIVAHELAHLARGDATRAARSARFVEALEQALERNGPRAARSARRLGAVLPASGVGAHRAGRALPGGACRPARRGDRRRQRRRLRPGQGRHRPALVPRAPRCLRSE